MSNFAIETKPRKNWLPGALGLTILGSATGWLGFKIKSDPISSDTLLPASVQRNLDIITKVHHSGETINGAWIAKEEADQAFIDSSRHVYSITLHNSSLGKNARSVLNKTINEVIEGLYDNRYSNYFDSEAEKKLLILRLEYLNNQLEQLSDTNRILELPLPASERLSMAHQIDKFSHKIRLTDTTTLRATYFESKRNLDNTIYFSMPDTSN